jgi:hypothetical protein
MIDFVARSLSKTKADMRYKFQDRSGKLDIALVVYNPGLLPSVTPEFDSKNILAVQTMTTTLTHNAIQKQKAIEPTTETLNQKVVQHATETLT